MKKFFVIGILAILVWSCSHKTAPPATTATTATATGDATAGQATYMAKCQRCHALKNPGDFTSDQWPPILNSMAVKAQLSDTEKANVLAYVLANAKQG